MSGFLDQEDQYEPDFSVDQLKIQDSQPKLFTSINQPNQQKKHQTQYLPNNEIGINQLQKNSHTQNQGITRQRRNSRRKRQKKDYSNYQIDLHGKSVSEQNQQIAIEEDEQYEPQQQQQEYGAKKKSRRNKKQKKKKNDKSYQQQSIASNLKKISWASYEVIKQKGCLTRDQLLEELKQVLNQKKPQRIKRRGYDALNVLSSLQLIYICKNQQNKGVIYSNEYLQSLPQATQQKIKKQQKNRKRKSHKKVSPSKRKKNQKKKQRKSQMENKDEQQQQPRYRSRQKNKPHHQKINLNASSKNNDGEDANHIDQKQQNVYNDKEAIFKQIQAKKRKIEFIKKAKQQALSTKHTLDSLMNKHLQSQQIQQICDIRTQRLQFPLIYAFYSGSHQIIKNDNNQSMTIKFQKLHQLGADINLAKLSSKIQVSSNWQNK